MQSQYQALLVFAVFIASGISFLDGALPRILVRITVAVVGIIAFLLLSFGILWGIAFSAGFGARSFGSDGLKILGATLIALYFAICAVTCLPVLANKNLRFFGLGLHFVFLPLAVYLTTLDAFNVHWWDNLDRYAYMLSMGLIYAMLWFRMLSLQKQVD